MGKLSTSHPAKIHSYTVLAHNLLGLENLALAGGSSETPTVPRAGGLIQFETPGLEEVAKSCDPRSYFLLIFWDFFLAFSYCIIMVRGGGLSKQALSFHEISILKCQTFQPKSKHPTQSAGSIVYLCRHYLHYHCLFFFSF